MADDLLVALYPQQSIVRNRNYSALLDWSAYMLAEAIPATPTADWVRQRIVAERIPANPYAYVESTMGYFAQSPNTTNRINDYLNAFNTDAVESSLSTDLSSIVTTFMPLFASQNVTNSDIVAWCQANGVTSPV